MPFLLESASIEMPNPHFDSRPNIIATNAKLQAVRWMHEQRSLIRRNWPAPIGRPELLEIEEPTSRRFFHGILHLVGQIAGKDLGKNSKSRYTS
jgi:hypothetical protein